MKTVEQRLAAIEKRNTRVEEDKAWETSWTRRVSVAGFTYLVVFSYLTLVVHSDRPFINAFVPTIGYLLSTLAVSWVRILWSRTRNN